jgi:hypothetical protein
MAQPKINPGHPVSRTSIPSDRESATGCGPVTKGYGKGIQTTSHALNHYEGKGYGAGKMGDRGGSK